ncbi:MAG: TonB-dependent receptor, partial [Acidobacteria bacterium]|nr:TonB-dependent receptor [Acidobacteriota bacterium]
FFFASYQGFRNRTAAFVNSGITPTEGQRGGDFSSFAANQRPVDPSTGSQFPGGLIPASLLDPMAQNILKLVPLPNTPDGRFQASASSQSNDDQGLLKMDHQISASHKITGSLFLDRNSVFDPFGSGTQIPDYARVNTAYDQRNVVANEDWIVTPALLNQVRFSYTLNSYSQASQVHTSWSDFGSKVTLGALPPRPPQIFVNGFWQMGTFGDNAMDQASYRVSDTLTWMRRGHSIRAGGGITHHSFLEHGNWLGAGQIRFSGSSTRNALADFLLGRANTFRQNNGQNRDFASKDWFGFFQDDWKVSRKFTLNLGLRYEIDEPLVSATDELQTFRFGVSSKVFPTAPLGLLFPGDPGIPRGVIPTSKKNFAPRLGVAVDPFGNGKTAIRAGWGIFYAATIANITSNLQGQPFLVDTTVNVTPNLNTPYANVPGGSPFPYTLDRANPRFSLPITASYIAENLGMPHVMQYNFTIQQQLTPQWSIQAGYVGNVSRKLYLQRDANAPVYIPGRSTAANVNSRRPYLPGTFGEIAQTQTAANAHYDSLQVSLNRRFSHGFTLMANFTWSKSIDIASDDQLNPTVVSFVDSNNLALDRAPSDFDTPRRLVVSYLWEVPGVKRWGLVGKQLLSGWQINGITDLRSGSPFNTTSNIDSNFDGNGTDRPDLVGNPRLDTGRSRPQLIAQYFNTAAFRAASGLYGTAGRNLVYGPGAVNWDFSAFKNFPIPESRKLQFRAEFFNLFNQVNFGNPNATLTSPNFGRILGAGAPRIVQFSLKFSF